MTTSNMVVLVMIPRVQSLFKLVSLRKITEGRKNKATTSSVVGLVMIPSVQSLLKSVSLREITLGRVKTMKFRVLGVVVEYSTRLVGKMILGKLGERTKKPSVSEVMVE